MKNIADKFYITLNAYKVKTYFNLHGYINNSGETQIILVASANGMKWKFPTGQFCKPIDWLKNEKRIKNNSPINIVLDNIEAKIIQIKTFYTLSGKVLTLDLLKKEFLDQSPNFDFISFFENQFEKQILKPNSVKNHKSVLKKIKEYQKIIPFNEISLEFFDNYRNYLSKQLGNSKVTINNNIKIIKKYLLLARRYKIPLNIDLDDLVVGSTAGNRIALDLQELEKLKKLYFDSSIGNSLKLSLGYFLFSCYTGLRISDVKQQNRKEILSGKIFFQAEKSGKMQSILINKTVVKILEEMPQLFEIWKAEQNINEDLKIIGTVLGFKKNLHFHISRHTFATNIIRKGGSAEDLQILLGHSDLKTTMQYVHMVRSESIKSVFLLDD